MVEDAARRFMEILTEGSDRTHGQTLISNRKPYSGMC
jgi:hypothetical protein